MKIVITIISIMLLSSCSISFKSISATTHYNRTIEQDLNHKHMSVIQANFEYGYKPTTYGRL